LRLKKDQNYPIFYISDLAKGVASTPLAPFPGCALVDNIKQLFRKTFEAVFNSESDLGKMMAYYRQGNMSTDIPEPRS